MNQHILNGIIFVNFKLVKIMREDPEIDNLAGGREQGGGKECFEHLCFFRPAKGGEWPQG